MKKVPWLMAGLLGVSLAMRVFAEDKKLVEPLNQYLEHLQVKLDHTAQRVNQPTSGGSSVVGLRGSKQESASKQLYWKGKDGKVPVAPDEVKLYRKAVDEATAGKKADSITSLNMFMEKYPKSALMPDVQETMHRLNDTVAAVPSK